MFLCIHLDGRSKGLSTFVLQDERFPFQEDASRFLPPACQIFQLFDWVQHISSLPHLKQPAYQRT